MLSLFTDDEKAINEIYNVACGERTTLKELWNMICEVHGVDIEVNYGPAREGDIPHSLASIDKSRKILNYNPEVDVLNGLKILANKSKFL